MKKAIALFFFITVLFPYVAAQIPLGYYDVTNGLTGDYLRIALKDITSSTHNKLSYNTLWTVYAKTDVRLPPADTVVWDMYTDIPNGTPFTLLNIFTNQCGTGGVGQEGICYAREHCMPNSWWGGIDNTANPQYSDLHHLFPADQYVNLKKSNYPLGQTFFPTYASNNGSKRGPCTFPGYTGTIFEPIDEYKGDFARAYLYMATRYMDVMGSWVKNFPTTQSKDVIDTLNNNFKPWVIDLLMLWHYTDTVSEKEIRRNDSIFYASGQNNRNPFIDHPEFVDAIWGNPSPLKPEPNSHASNINALVDYPYGRTITISWLDASDVVIPDGYIVRADTISFNNIQQPTDGIPIVVSLLDKIVGQGIQSATFTNLKHGTTYYFKIFPYTNFLNQVDYKTDGIVPKTFATTDLSLLAWQFGNPASTGNEANYTSTKTNEYLNPSVLYRGNGILPVALARGFSAREWNVGATKALAEVNNEYYEFKVSTKPGYAVSLSGIDLRLRRSSTGPNAYIWKYSLDNNLFYDIDTVQEFLSTADGVTQTQLNLSGITALQNVSDNTTITFRLYAWGSTSTTGTFSIARFPDADTSYCLQVSGSLNLNVKITGDTSVCQGETAVNYSIPNIENTSTYVWTLPSGASGSSNTNSIDIDFDINAIDGEVSVKAIRTSGDTIEASLFINVNSNYYFVDSAHICQGNTYVFNSQILKEGGTYTETHQTNTGCDSTHALVLSVTASPTTALWQFGVPPSNGDELIYAPTNTNNNIITPLLTRGNGITPVVLSRAFSARDWNAYATKQNAIDNNDYFQFEVKPQQGFEASLHAIDSRLRRSASGPNAYIWMYRLNSSPFIEIGSEVSFTSTADGVTQAAIDLSGISALEHIADTTTVTFRLYAWGATSTTGTLAFGRYPVADTTPCLSLKGIVKYKGDILGSTSVCENETNVSFSIPNTDNALAYIWHLPPGTTGSNSENVLNINFNNIIGAHSIKVNVVYPCADTCEISLNTVLQNTYEFNHSETICNGQTFIWRGSNYTAQGTYYDSLQTINDCDSVYILQLTVNPAYEYIQNEYICNGETFLWRGQSYSAQGVYYDSLSTALGCDSVFVLNLTVHQLAVVELTGLASNYCDINQNFIMQGTPQGGSFTGAGVTVNNFNPSVAGPGNWPITYCYTDNYNCFNCDTAYATVFEVLMAGSIASSQTICYNTSPGAFTNVQYPTGGTSQYTYQWQLQTGCVGAWTDILGAYASTYDDTGNLIQTTCYRRKVTSGSCGSVYSNVIAITFNPVYTITQNEQICTGETFIWRGNTFTSHGTYYDSLSSVNDCDSIYVLNLSVNPTYEYIDNNNMCIGETYFWHGNYYNIEGTYYDSLTTQLGCDSVYILNLSVSPSYNEFFNDTVCDGTAYVWRGDYYDTSGLYYDSLLTTAGCDSIFSLNIFFRALPLVSILNIDTIYCVYDAPVSLQGSPSGGIYIGNGISGNYFNPSIAGIGNWNIDYSFTDSYGCFNTDSLTLNVDACVGTAHLKKSDVHLYPNPTRGNFTIELNEDATLLIYNNIGFEILKKELTKGKHIINIPVKNDIYTVCVVRELSLKCLLLVSYK